MGLLSGDNDMWNICIAKFFYVYFPFLSYLISCLIFFPHLVPATEKVEKEAQPRFLEDEGFYVGTRPETSGWNQNKMEHRLLKEAESVRLSGLNSFIYIIQP